MNQPAITATKPAGKENRVDPKEPARRSSPPGAQDEADPGHREHASPRPNMRRKAKKGTQHRRAVLPRERFEPDFLGVEGSGGDEAAEVGNGDRETIGLLRGSGSRSAFPRPAARHASAPRSRRILPADICGRFSPVRWPRTICDRNDHGDEAEAPIEHDMGFFPGLAPQPYHAPVAATHMPVVRNAPSSICGQRTQHDRARVICPSSRRERSCRPRSCGRAEPASSCCCTMIQYDENIVPSATMQQAKK